jgi:hypothetical protein
MLPRPEIVGAIVFQANPSNVRHVLVAGRPVKRDGALVGVDMQRVKRLATEAQERVLANVLAHGPLLPEPTPDYDEQLSAMGEANVQRAHELARA